MDVSKIRFAKVKNLFKVLVFILKTETDENMFNYRTILFFVALFALLNKEPRLLMASWQVLEKKKWGPNLRQGKEGDFFMALMTL